MSVFTTLCDLVDELQRQVRSLDHSPQKLALEALVDRFDLLIDQTIGLDVPALEEAACPHCGELDCEASCTAAIQALEDENL